MAGRPEQETVCRTQQWRRRRVAEMSQEALSQLRASECVRVSQYKVKRPKTEEEDLRCDYGANRS